MLLNREVVGEPSKFDVELLGNCDAICAELWQRLGWENPPQPKPKPPPKPAQAPAASAAEGTGATDATDATVTATLLLPLLARPGAGPGMFTSI